MKKLIYALIAVFLLTGVQEAQAQDWKGLTKEVKKQFNRYRGNNDDKEALKKAVAEADKLLNADIPAENKADAYLLVADIYSEIANQINMSKSLNLNTAEDLPELDYPSIKAKDLYVMALENQQKKYHEKTALKGLRAVQNFMSFRGIEYYQAQDYAGAMKAFDGMIETHDILSDKGEESALSVEDNLNNQYYLAGLAAFGAKDVAKSKKYYTALYEKGYEESVVYEYLYKIGVEEGGLEGGAYKYLEEGREKFPEEITLLFAEINHFLQLGKSDELIEKIKLAIKAEPTNVSLYNVLGNTYDGLYQNASKEGEEEKAEGYFKNAFTQFKKAYEIDNKNNTAVYSMGQLFYNKAALKTQDLQKYASDYSADGMKKYEAAREEVFAQFDNALPFFQLSEALNPNDVNTLIALKEIFAKKDNIETSNIFKERLDALQAGDANAKSYYTPADVNLEVEMNKLGLDTPYSDNTTNNNTLKVIQMTKMPGGTYEIPCTVNGLDLKFIFDTGASDVSISLSEALFMFKNDYLKEDDITGTQTYSIANGDIAEGTTIRIRKLEFGGLTLYDVDASIVHELAAPLLLGQSAISRLGKIQIDPENSTLTIIEN